VTTCHNRVKLNLKTCQWSMEPHSNYTIRRAWRAESWYYHVWSALFEHLMSCIRSPEPEWDHSS